MKKYLFTYLILMLGFNFVTAQSKLGSSYSKSSKIDKKKVEKNLLLAESIYETDLSKALILIENNLMLAIEGTFEKEEALAYRILGDINYSLTNYDLALSKFIKALVIYEKIKENRETLNLYLKLGETYKILKKYNQAISRYEKALAKSKLFKSPIRQIEINYEIAEVYHAQNDYGKAKTIYSEVYSNTDNVFGTVLKIKSLIGLGKVAEQENEVDQAEQFYIEAEALANKSNKDDLANYAFDALTELYKKKKDINSEIQTQEQAYSYNSNRGNSNSMFINTTNLSLEYAKQGKKKKALNLLNSNIAIVDKEENSIEKINFIKTLAEVYEQNGLDDKAEIETTKYEKLLDSFLINKEKQNSIQSSKVENLKLSENKLLLMEKDRELNEKMIDILKREQVVKDATIQKQLTITYLLLGGLLIIGALTFFLFRSRKQQQKNNELLILKSLRSQMNPHFIFNSLNSVNSFIAKKDERSANKYLAEFSKLMREVLECSQHDFIPLAKEIQILKLYLNLEHFRFNSHFDFTFTIDSKINLDEYQIPPMLLQPFIENAIWHGLRYKKEKGNLDIRFVQNTNCIDVFITDDGIGRQASMEIKTSNQKKMKSTGIKNIENRLELIRSVFKKKLEITILDKDNSDEPGTAVNVKLY